ncbi:MAG: bifunctional UDP-N-acetylmuramoyl-tripeptide:D-alanyl-D-alanine ligase/alanine racemase [Bacteroidales bacterium]|jgi:alanine racemase|nr:bifunctional UDP-N-acetylmuramoyl-tripeptide:D-alanyl-D-alanine ligase/alanine racemase [Bacteroidales bacterium]
MKTFSAEQIAEVVEGKIFPEEKYYEQPVSRIITDSRTFFNYSEAVFFAIAGQRNNGHNYIPELIEKGVKLFVVSEPCIINSGATFILTTNTTEALQKLAASVRCSFNSTVVGITGSNGKTIVKEWLYDLLSDSFKILRNPKSYNSQIGVPLSVLLLNNNYNLAIFEAGISQNGEMQKIAEIIQPEIGIFTNIGDAHQENFTSIRQKIQEKLKLFQKSKKLVFRVDNEEINAECKKFCSKNSVIEYSWSMNGKPAAFMFFVQTGEKTTEISVNFNTESLVFEIPFTDNSAIENACHCFVAILATGENIIQKLPRFKNLEPVAMRLEIKQGINNCLLINDYYNSDLNSVTIALSVLCQQAVKGHLHKLLILSDILQTGISKNELYTHVNKLLQEWGIDELIGIGPEIYDNSACFSVKKTFFTQLSDFEKTFKKENFRNSVILIKGARKFTFEKISEMLQLKAHQTVFEINMNAIVHNLNVYKSLLKPQTKIMVMVKAFSYGMGDIEIAKLLQYQNVDYLAVAVTDEGVQLRNAGIKTPIIVMNPEAHSFQNMVDYCLEPNIYSIEVLEGIIKTVSKNAIEDFYVHLKLDTGMNRLGFKNQEEIRNAILLIKKSEHIKVKSVFSHLAGSDEPELDYFTIQQIQLFEQLSIIISKCFPYKIDKHILNSAGIERFSEKQFDMVRLGIGLYGISNTGLPLETTCTLKSTVSQVKTVGKNETVGYNRKGEIENESRIAIVPLGYADGIDRKLGNKNGLAFINGETVAIIGNICMDMLILDVSDVDVKPGDEVEFFGGNIPLAEVAKKAGTIPYEIITGVSQRVKRIYIHE